VYYRGGGYRGGHYGGYRGGYYGGYRGGYYGGYRGGYYGGYRGYYGGYRGYYGGYRGYYGGGYGAYYPYYGYSYYAPIDYCYPIAAVPAPVVTLQQTQATYVAPPVQYQSPVPAPLPGNVPNVQPMLPAGNGTFQYNGGPQQFVPAPPAYNDPPVPMKTMPSIIPLDGKLVSMPRETGGGVTPVSIPQGWNYVRAGNNAVQPAPAPVRINYPAYGENIVPTPVKNR